MSRTKIRKCDFRNDLDDTILYAVQMSIDGEKWFICSQAGRPSVFEDEVDRDEATRNYQEYQDSQGRQKKRSKKSPGNKIKTTNPNGSELMDYIRNHRHPKDLSQDLTDFYTEYELPKD